MERANPAHEAPAQYLPDNVFWSALSNAPRTALAGYLARLRGVRSGLTDIIVVYDGRVIWVEMKSPAGVASKVQRQVCAELRAAGADWYLARSAEAAAVALRLSNVPFRQPWTPPPLEPWEGPFTGAMICSGTSAAGAGGSGAAEGGTAGLARASASARP